MTLKKIEKNRLSLLLIGDVTPHGSPSVYDHHSHFTQSSSHLFPISLGHSKHIIEHDYVTEN